MRGHDLTKDQSKKAMEKQKEISDRLLEERDHCQEAFEQARQELWQQLQEARQQMQTLQTALEASRAHTTTLEDQVIYDASYFALLVQKYYAMYLLF